MVDITVPPALRFLLAARGREVEALRSLADTCGLVALIARFVHDLQKERGYSNIHLGCPGKLRLEVLDGFTAAAAASGQGVCAALEGIDTGGSGGSARLFSRIAHALYLLDGLPRLRRQVRDRAITSDESTDSFTRLIGSLLAVVFEAADAVSDPVFDPDVTRALAAMFNFMQGKELTGQERAVGVAAFSFGYFDAEQHERMRLLRERQQRCFELFLEHADDPRRRQWRELTSTESARQLARLRLLGQRTSVHAAVDPSLSESWFDACTQCIDAMKDVEDALAEDLIQRCFLSLDRVRAELGDRRGLVRRLAEAGDEPHPVLFRMHASSPVGMSSEGIDACPGDAAVENLQAQAAHLRQLEEELGNLHAALEARQRGDRAKRLLMKRLGLGEQDAHEYLQRRSMNSGRRLSAVIDEILGDRDSPEP